MTGALPFEAMLPLKIRGSHYGENIDRTNILLDSLDHFLDLPTKLDLTVICPPDEIGCAKSELGRRRSAVRLKFIAEDEVIPGVSDHRAIGWYKQQALKLAFATRCRTPFYLTLDPDILLCRTLRSDHLVQDGRCYTSWMSKAEHPHWWEASASVLKTIVDPLRMGLNVTPNMLCAKVAVELGTALSNRLNTPAPWHALLDVDARWTEYTLYSVFAEASGLLEKYHRDDLPDGRKLLGRSIWTPANFNNYSMTEIHDDPSGAFFTVCASHTGVSASVVRGLYNSLIENTALRAA